MDTVLYIFCILTIPYLIYFRMIACVYIYIHICIHIIYIYAYNIQNMVYIWLYHGSWLLTIPGMHHPPSNNRPPDLDRRHLQWLSEPWPSCVQTLFPGGEPCSHGAVVMKHDWLENPPINGESMVNLWWIYGKSCNDQKDLCFVVRYGHVWSSVIHIPM